uniref:Large ribosomal subunit protein uL13 n=1 Tax=Pristionchus pacificus TaxID=54126 RepID=A0A454XX78_PRIPA|eukprot:PDM65021.1 rpl-16 [Pristionchus pacificus]
MDAWFGISDAAERRRRISADLETFLSNLDESWRVRFSIGLTNALIDKLCEQSVLDLLFQLRLQQHQLESAENHARMELLKSLQLDPQIDSKMCQNDRNMGLINKALVIDGKNHLLGRLASIIAKQILLGQKVVVVRCEEICISGNFHRSKLKYMSFLRKRCNVNPRRGPFHLRSPSRILWRTVRGMVPHKTIRGTQALKLMRGYEGCPAPYDKTKKMVIPSANRHNALKPRRKFCTVGRLAHEVGWQYKDVVAKLEAKRKVKGALFYSDKKKLAKLEEQARKNVASKIAAYQKIIEGYGYA